MAAALVLITTLLLGGCATPPVPRDYTAFKKADPASLLVLPPLNDTPDVLATASVLAQVSYPLAESGFYVLPVSLVDETLRTNGMQTAADAHAIAPEKLRQIFGADAVLYVTVKRYGTVYNVLSSETAVALQARLVDLRSGELLWEGKSVASSAEQGGGGQGGVVGLLVKAVVEQITSSLSDRSYRIADVASQRLLSATQPNGILYGPRSPLYLQRKKP